MNKITLNISLVLLLLLGAGLAIYWTCAETPAVEALLRVRYVKSNSVGSETLETFDVYRHTQAELLKSPFVLTSALRDSEISKLPVITELDDPLDWLSSNVQTVPAMNSELISIRLPIPLGQRGQSEQWVKVLARIVESYQNEVVNRERLELVEMLTKCRKRYSIIYDQIRKKQDDVIAIRNLGASGGDSPFMREIALQRISVLESKVLELELQREADAMLATATKEHTLALQKQIEFVEEKLAAALRDVGDLQVRSGEEEARMIDLAGLRNECVATRDEMRKLETLLDRPPSVSLVQTPRVTTFDAYDARQLFADSY